MSGMSFDPIKSFRGQATISSVTPRGLSIVNTPEGFRQVDIVVSHKCRVCRSPHRALIDQQLLYSRGYKAILRMLPPEALEGDEPITTASIKNHCNSGHTTVRVRAANLAAEERAKEIGLSLEDTDATIVDFMTLGRAMMDRYYQHLQDGEVVPSGSEVVQVMRMFSALEAMGGGSVDSLAYLQALQVVLDAIRSVVPDRFDEIMARVRTSPVMQGIIAKRQEAIEAASAG